MTPIHQWPPAILRRWVILPAVGAACLLLGIAVGITQRDRLLFFLSLAVCAACGIKAVLFYRVAAREEYTVLEGVCVMLQQNPIRKSRRVKIVDGEDQIHVLALDKRVKLRVGHLYRFYLRQPGAAQALSSQTALPAPPDELLGYEEIEDAPSDGNTEENF